jgi:hypothetical protein
MSVSLVHWNVIASADTVSHGQYLSLSLQVCMAAGMNAFSECRYVQNGWQISTVAPNKGLADQVKKLILQTSARVPGAPLRPPLHSTLLRA